MAVTPPKILSFSSRLKSEIEKTAEEAGVTYEVAEETLYSFFRVIYHFLSDPRMPHITIHGFFKLHTTTGLIRRYILNGIKEFRSNPSFKSKAALIDRIISTWKVRNRLILANDYIRDGVKWAGEKNKTFLKQEKRIRLGDQHEVYYNRYGRLRRKKKVKSIN